MVGVREIVKEDDLARGREFPGVFALFDQVGCGKSKQAIDSAQILHEADVIDTIVVACPAFARGVWASDDPNFGEVAKHGWTTIPNRIVEYSVNAQQALTRDKLIHSKTPHDLRWIVSNYEFLRRPERLAPLEAYLATRRYMLVCDEAWALKDHSSAQWKAMHRLRSRARRTLLLNGTPVAHNPLDLYAQMRLLHPGILSTRYTTKYGKQAWTGYVQFRARYALLKANVSFPMIIGWQNLEELRAKVEPYVLCRTTRECFDLPPIMEPVTIEARLDDENWRLYRSMRDDMVAWLGGAEGTASFAKQAIVKAIRLHQITSGFLGGLQAVDFSEDGSGVVPGELIDGPPKEIGREKLDALIAWLKCQPVIPERLLVWCRFRPEVERTVDVLARELKRTGHKLYGSQPRSERAAAVAALNPDVDQPDDVVVVANENAGGAALNLSGAWMAVYLSHDRKLRALLQSMGRTDRPGQRNPIQYVDVVATGPKGQRTIDHHIIAGLRTGGDLAEWTAQTWRAKLLEE